MAEGGAVETEILPVPNSPPGVGFLQEPVGLEEKLAAFSTQSTFRHRLWTDAYLAALAIASGCRLVSFDSDFQTFDGLKFLHLAPS